VAAATLAERLGHDPAARLLIINCDDLGSSHSANVAIERAMTRGVATSATLMVPCPWARDAAQRMAGADVGVHLTLTAEYPGYRWRSLTGAPWLHDEDGFLPATAAAAIAKADPEDVRAECRAQIQQAFAWGIDVTHLDCHMGVLQIDARLFDIYLDLAVESGLPVRMAGRRADERLGFEGRRRALEHGVIFTDHLLGTWPIPARREIFERVPSLAAGVTELFGHPVNDGPELRGYDPDQPGLRADDAVCFADPAAMRVIREAGVIPISYRALRTLQRAA